MQGQTNTVDSLRRVFYEGFVAQDIAEPIASFDATADVDAVGTFMIDRPLSVVGIRRNGMIIGCIEQAYFDDRPLADQLAPLSEIQIVAATTPLHTVVNALSVAEFLLVSMLGQPVGVIVRNDFEKPPMRMWLFGMVTLFELSLTRIVANHYQGDSWTEFVSASRLEKAVSLQAERQRRNQSVRLIDCLQLGDKGQLLSRSEELRKRYWDRSRTQIKTILGQVEGLRNNLAHSQPLVTENWEVIVRISSTLERFLEIPSELIAPSSLSPYNSQLNAISNRQPE
ncbi:hypothetical protein Enr13x_75640 [Stieleria neptunia]|uniref:CBS domain-containing protein n=1 Tax=Stieleria neptunia TaxID=2527979 RepID=A0A518I3H1_9BACT|nr:hypothetical protein [Stieleria neptunia]QDV47653.1 hypothetical protein Enr13x_75640 [Stieleria neptunia]